MGEDRLTHFLGVAVSTFTVGSLFSAGLLLALHVANVQGDFVTSWGVAAAGCSLAAGALSGHPPERIPESVEVPKKSRAKLVAPPPPPAEFIGPVDYKLPHDAFRAAMRRVTKLTFRHDEAVKAGTESADFSAGYGRAVQDLNLAFLEEFDNLSRSTRQ